MISGDDGVQADIGVKLRNQRVVPVPGGPHHGSGAVVPIPEYPTSQLKTYNAERESEYLRRNLSLRSIFMISRHHSQLLTNASMSLKTHKVAVFGAVGESGGIIVNGLLKSTSPSFVSSRVSVSNGFSSAYSHRICD